MIFQLSPHIHVTEEDLSLDHIHRRFIAGEIGVAQLEIDVASALRGTYDRPFGGLPPVETGEAETR